MLNPEFVLENETHTILFVFWDANGPDLVIVNKKKKKKSKEKKNGRIVDYTVPVDHQVKPRESKKEK